MFSWILIIAYLGLSFAIALYFRSPACDYGFRYLYAVFPLCFIGIVFLFSPPSNKSRSISGLACPLFMVLCLMGFLSASSFKLNEHLHFSNDWMHTKNRFGVSGMATNPDYIRNLIREMPRPSYWYSLINQGYVRLVADGLMDTNFSSKVIPQRIHDSYGTYPMFRHLPFAAHAQAFILAVLWIGFGFAYGTAKPLSHFSTPSGDDGQPGT